MIYDPVVGDTDSGITPGKTFEAIPNGCHCPICKFTKKTFIPLEEKATA